MSKKFNNMILLYILAGLVIIFIIVKWYQNPKTESTLNAELVDIDTTKVSKILVYPSAENREEIKFYKEGKDWKVTKGKLIAESEPNAVKGMLSTLVDIKVLSLASKDKKKWDEYKVSDSAATRVKVYEGNDLVLDVMIGKFNYQQSRNPYGNMYGGGGVTGTTFIRLKDDDKIYAVDGFLIFTFNQQFNSFRKQTVAKFESSNVEKVSFKYPSDSSFVLELRDKKWMIGNNEVDSSKVAEFINSMSNKNASSFKDDFVNPGMSQYQLSIEGKNMKTVTIDCYYVIGMESFIINSNQNQKSWFSADPKGLFTEIFKSKATFFANKALKKK